MFAFQLGREFKLSIAEIYTVFPEGKTVYFDNNILIMDNLLIDKIINKSNFLGGTIKIIEIIENGTNLNISKFILDKALKKDGKFKYSINVFGKSINLKKALNDTKNLLKNNEISSRFVNKDFKNLSSSQIIGEKLIKNNSDFNIVNGNNIDYIGISIWVQNIDSYSKRDWQKDRDMQTGMLPPKLAQILINLSGGKIIYDPFVGLGTVLIESVLMGNKNVYGSDLSARMVEISKNNILGLNHKIEKIEIFEQNAKYISEVEFLGKNIIDSIVSEGYLGEIMTQKNISLDRIIKQKESLLKIYEGFFSGLKNIKYNGNIVICFPFWEINGKYFYFNEIYDLLNKYCNILKYFPDDSELKETKVGSLLYKRDKQLVGREIFKLKIKD